MKFPPAPGGDPKPCFADVLHQLAQRLWLDLYAGGGGVAVDSNYVTGQTTKYSSTTNSYIWYDGALQSSISYKPNTSQSTTWTTSFGYDALGRLGSAYIADGKPHSVTFTNDELGQIIRRDETQVTGQTGAPHEVWYRYGGQQLGWGSAARFRGAGLTAAGGGWQWRAARAGVAQW